ncbi:MAG: DUF3825 domain-containing protein [Firmicutes bacterium]|nr:DUF3825 domain-containing protein [Bacillota bacterium]
MLTEQNKIEIYHVLTGKFKTDVLYPLAEVGRELTLSGNGCRKYSFARTLELLENLPEYIILENDPENTEKYLVKILDWNEGTLSASQTADNGSSFSDLAETRNELSGSTLIYQNKPSEVMEFTNEVKEKIYRMLSSRFAVGTKIHMASISKYLIANGYAPRTYGFSKMKNMLGQMDEFLEMEDVVINQVPNVLITILREPIRETKDKKERISTYSERPEKPVYEYHQAEQQIRSTSGSVRFSGRDTGSIFREQPVPAEKPKVRRTEGNSNFDRLVYMPPKVVEFLNRKGMTDPGAVLSHSYAKSVAEQSFEQRGVTITFPVEWERGGEGMVAIIKKNEKPYGKQWFLTYVGFPKLDQEVIEEEEAREEQEEDLPLTPSKALESFAEIGYWQEFLRELADLAIPEKWETSNKKLGKYYLLKKYIQYTFFRLQQEEKVLVSEDGKLAAFNTGLLTSHYDEIFACFVPNPEGKTAWKFECFTLAGIRGKNEYGRMLSTYFNPLPEKALYVTDPGLLVYDERREIETDYAHLILDHLTRLPVGYLRECCYGDEDAQKILEMIDGAKVQTQLRQAYFAFSHYLSEHDKLYRRLVSRLEDAIETAKKRARWNYHSALAGFEPKEGVLLLMLPLCLEDDTHTDAALSICQDPSQESYQAYSILTPDQAYLMARLLSRLDPDWPEITSES